MDKPAVAGVEISADVLVVAFDNGQLRSSEFPNSAAGHQQMLRLCAGIQRRFVSAWNRPACMVWMLLWLSTSNPGSKSWWPIHVRYVILAAP